MEKTLENSTDEELMDCLIERGYNIQKDELLKELLDESESDYDTDTSSSKSEEDVLSDTSSLEDDTTFTVTLLERTYLLEKLPEHIVDAYWDEYCTLLYQAFCVYSKTFDNLINTVTENIKSANNL